jgi:hypothetical protein
MGLAISLTALAADRLNVRTGLWEITTSTEISGMPQLPAEVLANMTPEQRAQLAAVLGGNGKGPRVDKNQECVTEKDLEEPFKAQDRKECQSTVVKSSATQQDISLVCTGEHPAKGKLHVETPTPESMRGTIEIVAGDGDQPMTIKSKLTGKWLGKECKGS